MRTVDDEDDAPASLHYIADKLQQKVYGRRNEDGEWTYQLHPPGASPLIWTVVWPRKVNMTNRERLDHMRWIDLKIGYHEDCARLERATSWLHGTGTAKADFHTRQAERLRNLHTEACRRWGLKSVDDKLIATAEAA